MEDFGQGCQPDVLGGSGFEHSEQPNYRLECFAAGIFQVTGYCWILQSFVDYRHKALKPVINRKRIIGNVEERGSKQVLMPK